MSMNWHQMHQDDAEELQCSFLVCSSSVPCGQSGGLAWLYNVPVFLNLCELLPSGNTANYSCHPMQEE